MRVPTSLIAKRPWQFHKEFTLVNSDEELRHLANLNCEAGKIYIGQIFNEGLAHHLWWENGRAK